jgi:threonine/homoserine/homoserine lactone efflux protein
MLEPWVAAILTLAWLLGVGFVIWLVWRAAREDATEQEHAEAAETPEHPVSDDDRAA